MEARRGVARRRLRSYGGELRKSYPPLKASQDGGGGIARKRPSADTKSTFAISEELEGAVQDWIAAFASSQQRAVNFDVRSPFLSAVTEVGEPFLQSGFENERRTRSTYTAATARDLSSWLGNSARITGNQSLATRFKTVANDAIQVVSEEELLDRFADYQDALFDLSSATADLRAAAKDADEGLGSAQGDSSWLGRVKEMIRRMYERVQDALLRIATSVASQFKGFRDLAISIRDVLGATGQAVRDKLVNGFRRIARSLAAIATGLISKLLSWMGTVRKVAKQKGFKLAKATVTMDSIGFDVASVAGFPIPIPKLATPSVEFEFQ